MKFFKQEELNETFEREGYVIVPFLNEEEIDALTKLYYETHNLNHEGLYASAHSADYDFKKRLNDIILKKMQRSLMLLFDKAQPLGGSYIVKYKGENGSLPPHQDWTIVDENRFFSANIWIPLVDTNEENGAISILPRSHDLLKSIRAVNIPDPFYQITDYVLQHHQTLPMKAGEALIYDHRLLHASNVNKAETPRLAVVFGIIPERAEMRYYFQENGIVSEYESSVDFFFKNEILKGPANLKKLREIHYNVPVLTKKQFDELYFGIKETPENVSVFQRLKQCLKFFTVVKLFFLSFSFG